jgi:renal tumor antigen
MTGGYYDEKMDIWAYGCVLFEMVTKSPLFAGKNEIDQIHRINKVLGTPSLEFINRFKGKASHMELSDWDFPSKQGIGLEKVMAHIDPPKELINLLCKLLEYDPVKRITAE